MNCRLPRRITAACLFALTWLTAATAQAQPQPLKVVETVWGFDGRVVPGDFNPLSLLIDNLSDQAIEGQVTLRCVSGMVRDSGALLSEPIYLAPHTRRWVQFYPYVARYSGSWRLTVRTTTQVLLTDSFDTPRALYGLTTGTDGDDSLAAVILDRPGLATREPTSVKHMPAEIFPPYATATSGLKVLFLDHVPDWETPRQQALLSWLKSGGQLHLLLDSNSRVLQFSGPLAPLNDPFSEFSVGMGRVVRHETQRGQLTEQIVRPLVRPQIAAEDADAATQGQRVPIAQELSTPDPTSQDSDLLARMRELTQPEHAWWLIFLLSLTYVGLIFPGCWLLSQKRTLHYLATYGAIAGLAVVFSLLFLAIGRRGYGESTVMNSLSIARAEDETHWNAFQWNTLFVVSGDNYLIEAADQAALLASGNADEEVDATVRCGNAAVFDTRIPPFSSQSILSRRRVALPDWKLAVRSAEVGGSGLVRLEIDVGPEFPASADCQYLVLHEQRLFRLQLSADRRQLVSGQSVQTLADFCNIRPEMRFSGFFPLQQIPTADRFYAESIHMLLHRSLLSDGIIRPQQFRLPPDRVRLLVYAPTPDELQLAVNTESRTAGRTLYVRDLPLTTPP